MWLYVNTCVLCESDMWLVHADTSACHPIRWHLRCSRDASSSQVLLQTSARDLYSMLDGQGPARGTRASWCCTCDEFFCCCIAPCG